LKQAQNHVIRAQLPDGKLALGFGLAVGAIGGDRVIFAVWSYLSVVASDSDTVEHVTWSASLSG
jgi:hypothetical protein